MISKNNLIILIIVVLAFLSTFFIIQSFVNKKNKFNLELVTTPEKPEAEKQVKINVKLNDENDKVVENLQINHEKKAHFLLVRDDLTQFSHIHDKQDNSRISAIFDLEHVFHEGGNYLFIAEFFSGGMDIVERKMIYVNGEKKDYAENFDLNNSFNGYQVTLFNAEKIKPGNTVRLKYYIEKEGMPVNDLDLYLGATMHVSIFSEDLKNIVHTHGGMEMDSEMNNMRHASGLGPYVEFTNIFPTAGNYKLFGEFKHKGNVILTEFWINVS